MDEFFFSTNDFSLLENCQLYIIAKYKAINCCNIEAVIKRCSVKKVLLKILKIHRETPVPKSLFDKIAAYKETLAQVFSCEYCKKILRTPFLWNNSGGCF